MNVYNHAEALRKMPFLSKVRRQFQTLEFVPQYFKSTAKEWMNILFGESLVGVVFLIWWALGSPPLVIIFLLAVLVAGYYVWRAAFVHLIPRIQISRFVVTPTPTNHIGVFQAYVHIIPECLTKSSVNKCQGYLLRVSKQSSVTGEWEPTEIDEPLELVWSIYDNANPRALQHGIDTRLNLCFISSVSNKIHPAVNVLPFRFSDTFNNAKKFKFDIRLIAENCPAVDASVSVETGDSWDHPRVEILPAKS